MAFGFDTDNEMGSLLTVKFNFVNGNYQNTYTVPTGTFPIFFGFESSAPDIASVVISGNGSSGLGFAVDNFTFGAQAASSVPEPGLLLPLAGAFAFLYSLRRRRS